jgi:acetyltransferase-like isoleucine patch superfamily enzyme
VVLHDVPDHAVAVGAPARVVRLIAPELETATP